MPQLTPEERQAKLQQLAEAEGFFSVEEMLQDAALDSVCFGICTNPGCSYSTEVEPDQDRGWCENCNTNTVISALRLAQLI